MLCWETEDDNSVEPAGPRGLFRALIKRSEESSSFLYIFFKHIILSPVSVPGPVRESNGAEEGSCFHFQLSQNCWMGLSALKSDLIVIHSFLDALRQQTQQLSNSHSALLLAETDKEKHRMHCISLVHVTWELAEFSAVWILVVGFRW